MPQAIRNALTIAGSDSGGGAGIQADLKAFSAHGVYGLSVITALTSQNTREVRGVHPVPVDFIGQQIDVVSEDIRIDSVKIGMLSEPAIIETVAAGIKRHNLPNVVLDPVMVAKSGDKLLHDNAVSTLRSTLMPQALLVTPNLPEAGVLLDRQEPSSENEMIDAAHALHELGARNVLVKGGHLKGKTNVDVLFDGERIFRFEHDHIETTNTHGTGCTLSSSIAALLAREFSLEEAVSASTDYIFSAIRHADQLDVGHGHGPVHHFHALWENIQ